MPLLSTSYPKIIFSVCKGFLVPYTSYKLVFAAKNYFKYLLAGGIFFSFGWALTGACPGPMFTLAGAGYGIILVPVASAVFGTWVYGVLRPKLPH